MFMIASMNFILCPTDNGDVECVRAALRVHGGIHEYHNPCRWCLL